jgi:hypothetical protein
MGHGILLASALSVATASTASSVSTAATAVAAPAQSPAQSRTPACVVKPVDFKGWKAHELSNGWVTLILVPQLGGRLMQVTFGDHDYLFVNDQLKGQVHPPEVSAAQRKWFNYGGDKLWPMPEGSDNEQQWASAVGSVLDSGAFSFEVISQGATCAVRMVSPPDPQTGVEYTREIAIGRDTPEIRFSAIVKNVTGYPLRWSVQSVSQYNVADPKNPADYNHDFWGFTPAHPRSEYLNGYHVRTGQASNSAYAIRDDLFTLHFGDQGGEVWIDSPGNWVAVVDGATNYTMVERFHYERTAEYPGKGTVIFYTTGLPRPPRTPPPADAPPRQPIYYIEAEINSPMVDLAPGERFTMRTEWFPTRMGRAFKSATYAGVVGQPLTVTAAAPNTTAPNPTGQNPTGQNVTAPAPPRGLTIAGEFGVFFAGRLVARFYDREGLALGAAPLVEVNPLRPVVLQTAVSAPAETTRVSVHLVDPNGLDRGPLGEAAVTVQPAGAK